MTEHNDEKLTPITELHAETKIPPLEEATSADELAASDVEAITEHMHKPGETEPLTQETVEEAFSQQGPKVLQTAEEVQIERDLLDELAGWEADQIDPANVGMNALRTIARMAAIEEVLINAGLTDQKKLDHLLNVHLLEEMQRAHEAFRPMIESRRRASLGLDQAPTLILPNGEQVRVQ